MSGCTSCPSSQVCSSSMAYPRVIYNTVRMSAMRLSTIWKTALGINWYPALASARCCSPALPFGGYPQSGWGREMSYEAIELYTEIKAVAVAL